MRVPDFSRKYPATPGCKNPNEYKDCGEQTIYINERFERLNLDDEWYFLLNSGFGHAWGVATSSNTDDPVLHYDPRENDFSEGEPCKSCRPWFGNSFYSDQMPLIFPPLK